MWKKKTTWYLTTEGIRICLILTLALTILCLRPLSVNAAEKLNKTQLTLTAKKTYSLTVKGGKGVSWTSSQPSIASVNRSGLVTAIKKGTCKVTCTTKTGKTLTCTVNVRARKKSRYVTNAQAAIWLNILGAVESGGMVYGNRDYACFAGPGSGSPNEYSCTAGAYQEYGENLRQLLLEIQKEYPISFKKRDKAGIASDLNHSWDATPYAVSAGSTKAVYIQKIITFSRARDVQDLRAIALLDEYLDHIKSLGVTNLRCALFMAECEHLGGSAAVERVVKRAGNKNKLSSLRTSLYKDRLDTSNSYQIGDTYYHARHEAIYKWLKAYIPAKAKI